MRVECFHRINRISVYHLTTRCRRRILDPTARSKTPSTGEETLMSWRARIVLVEALLGLPGRLPSQYDDVRKLARIGGYIGLGVGLLLAAVFGSGLLAACLVVLAGSLLGGCVALWRRRSDVCLPNTVKPKREIEIIRCLGCGLMALAGIVATILRPNILTIFGILFFAWFALRYYYRQQDLTRLSDFSR